MMRQAGREGKRGKCVCADDEKSDFPGNRNFTARRTPRSMERSVLRREGIRPSNVAAEAMQGGFLP
jgi:hypothetical protein